MTANSLPDYCTTKSPLWGLRQNYKMVGLCGGERHSMRQLSSPSNLRIYYQFKLSSLAYVASPMSLPSNLCLGQPRHRTDAVHQLNSLTPRTTAIDCPVSFVSARVWSREGFPKHPSSSLVRSSGDMVWQRGLRECLGSPH